MLPRDVPFGLECEIKRRRNLLLFSRICKEGKCVIGLQGATLQAFLATTASYKEEDVKLEAN